MEIRTIWIVVIVHLPLVVSVALGIVLPSMGYCPTGTCKR